MATTTMTMSIHMIGNHGDHKVNPEVVLDERRKMWDNAQSLSINAKTSQLSIFSKKDEGGGKKVKEKGGSGEDGEEGGSGGDGVEEME